MAQKIIKGGIDLKLDSSWLFYSANNCEFEYVVVGGKLRNIVERYLSGAFTNGTRMYPWYDYMDPTINNTVNGKEDKTSQRLHVSYLASAVAVAFSQQAVQFAGHLRLIVHYRNPYQTAVRPEVSPGAAT